MTLYALYLVSTEKIYPRNMFPLRSAVVSTLYEGDNKHNNSNNNNNNNIASCVCYAGPVNSR